MNPPDLRKWLQALGVLCAGSLTAAEANAKINALIPILENDYTPRHFNAETLARAAKASRFFPSYAELAEVLTAWGRENPAPNANVLTGPPRNREAITDAEREARHQEEAYYAGRRLNPPDHWRHKPGPWPFAGDNRLLREIPEAERAERTDMIRARWDAPNTASPFAKVTP